MGHLFPAKQVSERTFPMLGKVPKEHLRGNTALFPLKNLPRAKHAGATATNWNYGGSEDKTPILSGRKQSC